MELKSNLLELKNGSILLLLLQSQHQNPFAHCTQLHALTNFVNALVHHTCRIGFISNLGCCTCALQTLCCMVFVVVIICLAIALGIYFGIFHNRDSNSSTTTTTPSSLILRALMPDGFHEEKESSWVY